MEMLTCNKKSLNKKAKLYRIRNCNKAKRSTLVTEKNNQQKMVNQRKAKWIVSYFKNWKNILTFIFLSVLVTAGFYLRIRNLGYLSFWGDDGHTVIGTLSIIKHGYPLLPSGFVLFHSILHYYLNVIPVLIFGATEFALRLTSVVFGCGTIVLVYFAGRDIANKFCGFLAAVLVTFSTWYLYFSREARYFSQLQFFFLLSFYFFYLGFIKEKKPFRILTVIFFILTPLIHGNGFLLIIAFFALLFYKGRKFFKKEIIIPFVIILLLYVLQVINQVFFWKVGRSFYAAGGGVRDIVSAYFKLPDPYYFKALNIMFPQMFFIFIAGFAVFIALAVFLSIKKSFKFKELYLNENEMIAGRARFGFNLFFLYFVFTIAVAIISFGQMYNQHRYIYFLMPLFVLIFSYIVFTISMVLSKFIEAFIKKVSGKKIILAASNSILIVIFIVISFFTVSGIDAGQAYAIDKIEHADSLNTWYSISTSMTYHWDAAATGRHVAENMEEGDIVITTDVYNSYPYTRKIDYWLWTGSLVSWQPYHLADDGEVRDDTYGAVVIRDIYKFIDIMNDNHGKNVWIICSSSLMHPEHVDPLFRQFFDSKPDNLVLLGRDNVSRLYYFPKTESISRIFITDFISPDDKNTLKPDEENTVYLDFRDEKSKPYLISGWSSVERGLGTWATGSVSVLFVDFDKSGFDINKQSELSITAKPLPHPDMIQDIGLKINAQLVDSIRLIKKEDFGLYSVVINPGVFKAGINSIELEYGYSFTPLELGLGNDARKLSVMFGELTIKN
ncbi:MAG: hypothetical protein FJW69_06755 [Actinobacteria bacterium]|nr:hypothetical protein [Actinomycetota bacterium]